MRGVSFRDQDNPEREHFSKTVIKKLGWEKEAPTEPGGAAFWIGTAIGASANVIVVGMAQKAGRKISFGQFAAYGLPVMLVTVAVATAYVWIRYHQLAG